MRMELEQINWPSTLFWIDNVENKPETYTYKLQPQWLKVLKEAVKIGRIAQESGIDLTPEEICNRLVTQGKLPINPECSEQLVRLLNAANKAMEINASMEEWLSPL